MGFSAFPGILESSGLAGSTRRPQQPPRSSSVSLAAGSVAAGGLSCSLPGDSNPSFHPCHRGLLRRVQTRFHTRISPCQHQPVPPSRAASCQPTEDRIKGKNPVLRRERAALRKRPKSQAGATGRRARCSQQLLVPRRWERAGNCCVPAVPLPHSATPANAAAALTSDRRSPKRCCSDPQLQDHTSNRRFLHSVFAERHKINTRG